MRSCVFLIFSASLLGAQSLSHEWNAALPKWLRFSGEYRARFEGYDNILFRPDASDGYLLNRIRLSLAIRTTDWLKFHFQAQDSRIFGNDRIASAPPNRDPIDLRLGYVELGDPEKRPVSLRAGRQELNFGDQRLVGSSNWTNTARTFDAVRLTFRHGGARLDAFVSSVVIPDPNQFNRPVTGSNLHGLYGSLTKLVPQATVEPYVFWRLAPNIAGENGVRGSLDEKTVGLRWIGKAGRLDYGIEMDAQTGSVGATSVRAFAGHWVVGYTAGKSRLKPRVSAEYNLATGDKDPRDGRRETFDHLYPTAHNKYGLADQVGWKNIHDMRGGFDLKPTAGSSIAANFHNWYLASARDALYNSGGTALFRSVDGAAGRHVGEEIDFDASFALTAELTFGAGIGHIFPGEFLRRVSPGKGLTFPYLMIGYSF